jgi:hypothetical protein
MNDTILRFLIPFIIIDLIVMVIILRRVLKLKVEVTTNFVNAGHGPVTFEQLKAIGQFAREEHAKIGEYMRANWSGFAEQLPSVIIALLDQLERDARAKGLTLDRDVLKPMLASSLRAHKIGRGRELSEALKLVA